ncbi:ribosomal protein S18-alanine N-acetyltransferase [Neisseriaceae bacterium ESL0693]|nr:ribosomal protein S18-alanine N-acetyltransferase [Neisseriaceae bacterium ESL0693]
MNIRLATQADIPALSQLETLCQPAPWSASMLTQALTAPSQIWVGLIEHKIVTMLVWQTILDEAEIHLLNTHPEYQRMGYASLMLRHVFTEAASQRLSRLLLEVRAGNLAAQALYLQHGFQVCGRRKHYYAGVEDALILEKIC